MYKEAGANNMKSNLITIAGAALFTLALQVGASATTLYNVSGSWVFPADSFTGSLYVSGSSVTLDPNPPGIELTGSGIMGTVDLTNVVSSSKVGPFYGVTVNDGTSVGDYSLFFDFTLPNANNKKGILDLAALSEIVACSGRGCKDGEETKVLAIFGFGDVTVGGVVNSSNAAPLPPTLSLFATGLVMLGWFGWRRKRNNAAFTAAV
jgi:hypothetical protein